MPEPTHDWRDHRGQLIFDIGMHVGEDTAYYLHRGHRVVAVEAHPSLCMRARERFAEQLEAGRLVIENVAIASAPQVEFFASANDQWGTIRPDWVTRNERLGSKVTTSTQLRGTSVAELIQTYGEPHYIKTDIEGADRLVLDSLETTHVRPEYLSIEAEKTSWQGLCDEIGQLARLGYDLFQAVPQHTVARDAAGADEAGYEFPFSGSSGPFGDDLQGIWLDRSQILDQYRRIFWRYRLFGDRAETGSIPRRTAASLFRRLFGEAGWWDTHARLHGLSQMETSDR